MTLPSTAHDNKPPRHPLYVNGCRGGFILSGQISW